MELARLYDGDQRVVSNVGGRPWATLRRAGPRLALQGVLLSQRPKPEPPARPPLELLKSPRGRVRAAKPYPKRPYGGPFETVVARGRAVAPEVMVETTHRFERDWIQTAWRITRRVRGRYTVDVLFPSWGKNATVEAILAGGKRVTLAGPGKPRRKVSLAKVAYFYVAGEDSGYVMLPVEHRPKAVAHVAAPARPVILTPARPDARPAAESRAPLLAPRPGDANRPRRGPRPRPRW